MTTHSIFLFFQWICAHDQIWFLCDINITLHQLSNCWSYFGANCKQWHLVLRIAEIFSHHHTKDPSLNLNQVCSFWGPQFFSNCLALIQLNFIMTPPPPFFLSWAKFRVVDQCVKPGWYLQIPFWFVNRKASKLIYSSKKELALNYFLFGHYVKVP